MYEQLGYPEKGGLNRPLYWYGTCTMTQKKHREVQGGTPISIWKCNARFPHGRPYQPRISTQKRESRPIICDKPFIHLDKPPPQLYRIMPIHRHVSSTYISHAPEASLLPTQQIHPTVSLPAQKQRRREKQKQLLPNHVKGTRAKKKKKKKAKTLSRPWPPVCVCVHILDAPPLNSGEIWWQ